MTTNNTMIETLPGQLHIMYVHPDGRWLKVYHLEKHFGGPNEIDIHTVYRNDCIPQEHWIAAPSGLWRKVGK